MNDRFKFRVWNKPGNSYISAKDDADFVYLEEEGNITVGLYNGDEEDILYLKEEDLIVEQCTGLKDKNGRLIYEGDIIRLPWQAGWPDLIGVVKFNELYACFLLSKTITDRAEQSFWWNDSKEVIGNIHEKPELLKECK